VARGGLVPAAPEPSPRTVYLLQRKTSKVGAGLGKTTGWVHRSALKARGVETIKGVEYARIDDAGLHINVMSKGGRGSSARVLEVDDVVVCAGQESRRDLLAELQAAGVSVHVIGGADVAAELDAKRAIDQGTRLAATL
jgi:2,4-dienoyl-CoA reductase (NADPH2)